MHAVMFDRHQIKSCLRQNEMCHVIIAPKTTWLLHFLKYLPWTAMLHTYLINHWTAWIMKELCMFCACREILEQIACTSSHVILWSIFNDRQWVESSLGARVQFLFPFTNIFRLFIVTSEYLCFYCNTLFLQLEVLNYLPSLNRHRLRGGLRGIVPC